MKLKTIIQNFGKEIIANNKTYQFDRLGYCEVEDEEAKLLIEKYPKLFFDEDKKKEEKKNLTPIEEYTAEHVSKLDKEIIFLKDRIDDLKGEIGLREDEIAVWKDKFQTVSGGNGDQVKMLTEENETLKKQLGLLEFKCELVGSTVNELRDLCSESKHEKSQWDKLSKEDLVKFLLVKAEEALSKGE